MARKEDYSQWHWQGGSAISQAIHEAQNTRTIAYKRKKKKSKHVKAVH